MIEYSILEPWEMMDENGLVYEHGSLMAYFQDVLDRRKARGKRYSLVTLLLLVFLAKLSGMDSPSAIADWCQARTKVLTELLHLSYPKLPSHSTIRRLFAKTIDEEDFEQRMRAYTAQQRGAAQAEGVLSLDGKKQRGTISPAETQGEATLAIYDPDSQEVIAQAAIGPGKGEIPTAQQLLEQVDVSHKVILADAMHTQRKLCQQVVEAQGDYLLTVKENQPKLYQDLEMLFTTPGAHPHLMDFQTAQKPSNGHGRIEVRTLTAVSLLPGEIDWPYLAQAFRLESRFSYVRKGQTVRVEHKVRYGITSLSRKRAHSQRLLALKRKYWSIENGLHYRRDVTFHEDATRMSHPHASCNLSTVHNTILSLFARLGCGNAAATRRFLAADLGKTFLLLIAAHPRL